MEKIREKLNSAALELKIAVFCAVIMVLSGIYKVIDPKLGNVINDLAIATFCMSLAVFVYKLIFGSFRECLHKIICPNGNATTKDSGKKTLG